MLHRYTGVAVGVLTLAFLFIFAVNVSLNTSLQSAQVAAPPAQSTWNFDEGSGTTIDDSGALGINDGSTSGTTWASGKNGTGLQFTRTSGTASFGLATNNFGISNTFSVAFWVNPQSTNTGSFIPILRRGQFVYPFMFSVGNASGGTVQIRSSARAASTNHLVATVSSNTWHHVASVYNGSTHTLYIDGAPVNSAALTGTPLLSGSQETAAGISFGGTTGFDGILDELKIYNTALSASEVAALAGGSAPPPPPATIDLTVTKSGTGSGTVASNPAGINCGTDCNEAYVSTVTSVTLTATPASGSTFVGWGAPCSGTSACTVTSSATVNAQFDTSITPPPPSGNVRFIRPVGYRTGCTATICNGSSWTNAHNGWPSSFARGVIYYVAEGVYPGPVINTGVSGSQYITIRKATSDNPEVTSGGGWTSSLSNGVADAGDPGRVEFTSRIDINTSFVIFDGVTGGGPGSWTSGHGFVIPNATARGVQFPSGSILSNIEVRHLAIIYSANINLPYPACIGTTNAATELAFVPPSQDGIYGNFGNGGGGISNTVFSHLYIESPGRTAILTIGNYNNFTFENSYIRRASVKATLTNPTTGLKSCQHGEIWSANHLPDSFVNSTIRNNFFDIYGSTGGLILSGINGMYIYGNVFRGMTTQANGTVSNWDPDEAPSTNVHVFNNTFIDTDASVGTSNGSGWTAYNNLYYSNNRTTFSGSVQHDYSAADVNLSEVNQQTGITSAIFTNYTGNDFRLAQATAPGKNDFAASLRTDPFGKTRGADGVWDRGAYEFTGSVALPTLSISKSGTGSGTVISVPTGINCGTDCTQSYTSGTTVTLTATPASGSTFTGWSDPACTGMGTCTVTMNAAKSITATFALPGDTTAPTVSMTGPLNGSTVSGITPISANASDNVGVVGVQFLLNNAPFGVEDTISPYSINWDTLISGNGLFTVAARARDAASNQTTSAPVSVTVNNIASFLLSVAKSGTGSGVVSSSPAGISCGSTCSASYREGTSVTLIATPASGSTFAGWSDPACPGTGACVVTMNAVKNITAAFGIATFHTLTASTTGSGVGSIFSNPAGISCGADCSGNYEEGTSVTLTATPGADSTFNSWSGACSGTNATCTVSMTQARSVIATFDPVIPPCTISSALWSQTTAVEGDTVMMNTVKSNCDSEQFVYSIYEKDVFFDNLIATTTSSSWQTIYVDDALTNPEYYFTVTIPSTSQVVDSQSFGPLLDVSPLPPTLFTLTTTLSGAGSGTITSIPAGITCGADCTENYTSGTSVTLTATPALGSTFAGWSGACTGTGTCTVSMIAARSVSATFTLPSDTTPPTISNIRILNKTATSFTVDWNTNEATTGGVNYGTTHSYGTYAPDEGSATTDHRVVIENLNRKTTYFFRVTATDAAGNTSQSAEFSVTTESRLPRPPKVTNVSATEGSVILSWENPDDYEYFTKTIVFRRTDNRAESPDPRFQVLETASSTWRDTDVKPGTTYHYTFFTIDDEGKRSDPEFVSFTTAGSRDTAPASPPRGGGGGGGSRSSGGGTTYYYSRPTVDANTLLRALVQLLLGRQQPTQNSGGRVSAPISNAPQLAPSPNTYSGGTGGGGGNALRGGTATNSAQAFSASEAIILRERMQSIFKVLTQLVQVLSLRSGGG